MVLKSVTTYPRSAAEFRHALESSAQSRRDIDCTITGDRFVLSIAGPATMPAGPTYMPLRPRLEGFVVVNGPLATVETRFSRSPFRWLPIAIAGSFIFSILIGSAGGIGAGAFSPADLVPIAFAALVTAAVGVTIRIDAAIAASDMERLQSFFDAVCRS